MVVSLNFRLESNKEEEEGLRGENVRGIEIDVVQDNPVDQVLGLRSRVEGRERLRLIDCCITQL